MLNVSVLVVAPVGRVIVKRSANTALPVILKSSTRNVFEIRNLLVANQVTPISPSQYGRSESPVMLYWPKFSVFGVALGGLGGQPVTLGLKFVPVKFSTWVKLVSDLLQTTLAVISSCLAISV